MFDRTPQTLRSLALSALLLAPLPAWASFGEECLSEGCDDEEVSELYASYAEECLSEGCSPEEVIELAGGTQHVQAMRDAFVRRGFRVNEEDFRKALCAPIGSETQCAAFLLLCKDTYRCPSGLEESAWYVCGGCIGFGGGDSGSGEGGGCSR